MSAEDFTQFIAHWQPFFALAGTAAATLVGLLFVAVSLHLDLFSDEREKQTRISAQQTLTNFFNILVLSLLFNIPNWDQPSIGAAVIIIGMIGVLRALVMLFNHGRAGWSAPLGLPFLSRAYVLFLFRQIAFPVLAYGTIILSGKAIGDGHTDAMNAVASLTIALLIGAGWSAWNLMVNLSRYRTRRNASQQAEPAAGHPGSSDS